jgi:hypothetical protein
MPEFHCRTGPCRGAEPHAGARPRLGRAAGDALPPKVGVVCGVVFTASTLDDADPGRQLGDDLQMETS